MIAYIEGKIVFLDDRRLVISACGLGLELHPSANAKELAQLGQECGLFVFTYIRGEEIKLFGFADMTERDLFALLNSVSGVGPKVALTIIDTLGVDGTLTAATQGDTAAFTAVQGVGTRLAERLALELNHKISRFMPDFPPKTTAQTKESAQKARSKLSELGEALVSLGFKRNQINPVIRELRSETNRPLEELLRLALRRLR